MRICQQISSYLLNILFLLGWGCFYVACLTSVVKGIIPGNIYHGGKPTDFNFYLFCFWLLGILTIYSLLFYKYAKQIFIKKVENKHKIIVISKSLLLAILMLALYAAGQWLSLYFHIGHIAQGFWY